MTPQRDKAPEDGWIQAILIYIVYPEVSIAVYNQ